MNSTPSSPSAPGVVRLETARFLYDRMAASSGKTGLPFDEAITSGIEAETLDKASKYMHRLAATKQESPLGHVFINGKYSSMAGVGGDNGAVLMLSIGWEMYRTN